MARSECARCKVTFSGVTAFDMHLRDSGRVHLDPGWIPGLCQRPDGVWAEDRPRDENALSRIYRAAESRLQPGGGVIA